MIFVQPTNYKEPLRLLMNAEMAAIKLC